MQYDPQTPIDTVFDQVKDLLEYRELDIFPYNYIHTTNIAYTIINMTRKFQDEIKTWNRMNPFQKNGYILRPIFAHPTASLRKLAN